MAVGLPPPPVNDVPGSFTWMEWYRQLRNYVSTSGSVPWFIINFAGSNITDIASRSHNNLQTLQGGTSGEMYHLTAAQYASLGIGAHNALNGIQGGTATERYHLPQISHDQVVAKAFPDLKIGNVSGGNYTNISSAGTISLIGNASGWADLRVEPVIKIAGVNDPTYTAWFTNGAGSRGVFLYNFTDVITASEKEITFSVQMPHSWKGTAIYPHVHWTPSIAGIGQRPVWGLEYTWSNRGVAFGNSVI